jgi:hypothetical protein
VRGTEAGGSLRALEEARSVLEGVKDGGGKKAGEGEEAIEEGSSFAWMEGGLTEKMEEKSI